MQSQVFGHVGERLQQIGEDAIERGATDTDIQGLRRQFVADNEQENGMFDQMVMWTIDRAYQEMASE